MDPTFNTSGYVLFSVTPGVSNDEFFAVKLRADQKLVAMGGNFQPVGDLLLARFNPDGTIDTGFGTNGYATYDVAGSYDKTFSGYLRADGKIIVSGIGSLPNNDLQIAVLRTDEDGTPDPVFGTDGRATVNIGPGNEAGLGAASAQNGDVLVVGYSTANNFSNSVLLRLNGSDAVGVEESHAAAPLRAYPMPFTDRFTVRVPGANATLLRPRLYDLTGRELPLQVEQSYGGMEQDRSLLLTVPREVPAGPYLLRVSGSSGEQRMVVIKE